MQSFRRLWPWVIVVLGLQLVLLSSLLAPPIAQSMGWVANPRQNSEFQTQLRLLVDQAEWIGRGRVVSSRSFWNEDRSAIASEHTVEVYYTLLGEELPALTVHTAGGYLPAEKLGMVDTRTATFQPGEEVLIFLKKAGATYHIVGRESGKYTIIDGSAVNAFWREAWGLAELYGLIAEEISQQTRTSRLPADWALREPQVRSAAAFAPAGFVYLNLKWDVNSVKFKININTTQAGGSSGSVQEFRQAIITGAENWSLVAEADFSLLEDGATNVTEPTLNGKNEIMFMKRGANDVAGQGRLWYTENRIIKEADMWLNDDRLWDATGSPDNDEIDLESVALHEFGHWLGLGHDSDSSAVMYSTLTLGTLKRALTSNDQAGIIYIYPCASIPCQPVYTPTATPTPSATATPTATPTSIATPTFSSTAPPGHVATPTPTVTATTAPIGNPSLTPSPRSTTQSDGSVFLPVVQK